MCFKQFIDLYVLFIDILRLFSLSYTISFEHYVNDEAIVRKMKEKIVFNSGCLCLFFFQLGLVMISSLMIVTSIAMLAFPKQLRGNRIPSPHQVETIDAHKAMPKVQKDDEEEELRPTLKGI